MPWHAVACILVLCGFALWLLVPVQPSPPQPRHASPDGRYAVVLVSDTNFGQIERLRVLIDPEKPEARLIFEAVGDVPLRFRGWRDSTTAELETPPHDGVVARRLVLRCTVSACRLETMPQP